MSNIQYIKADKSTTTTHQDCDDQIRSRHQGEVVHVPASWPQGWRWWRPGRGRRDAAVVDPQHRDELASAPMAKRQDRQKTRGWRRCGLGKRATGGGLGASGQFGGKLNQLEPWRELRKRDFFFTRRLIVIIGNCKHF